MNSTPNSAGGGGRNHECAVHLGVAAWLQHEASAVEIEPAGRVMALVQDGDAAGLGEACHDEAHRFAAGVHLDGAVGGDRMGREVGHGGSALAAPVRPPVWLDSLQGRLQTRRQREGHGVASIARSTSRGNRA